ncbi:hypothetical protein N7495_004734 [Penicillium taxi]|uniref:uncharacterized protein n=1 Tax=Penicillium taxi TaxID=168475 RepID=UPI0025458989|nr:uncharacterized protein N7495_004734 [Penicillium taxi]KAJ5899990.1 hypothetical protein N7495_004734 [Penicillium taxi]
MECKPAITTVSLGSCNFHNILDKIGKASKHGFKAIEVFMDDLESLAKEINSIPATSEAPRESILAAAHQVRQHCDNLNVTVLNLQPLRFYEGLIDRQKRDHILDNIIPIWIDTLKILGADTILVPSNFLPADPQTGLPQTTGDLDIIIDDLRELAARGARHEPAIKFAYEALAWGTHVNTWEKSWEIVQGVDRPNLGLALDTFNIAGAIYADPTSDDGRVQSAEATFHSSLRRMYTSLDISRVFIVQIADGERLSQPLGPGHPFYIEGQPSRLGWSRNCRLFLCEEDRGGYLPVIEIVRAILDLGWTGYLAYEVFSRTLADSDPLTPAQHAERAELSWQQLCLRMQNQKAQITISAAGDIPSLREYERPAEFRKLASEYNKTTVK